MATERKARSKVLESVHSAARGLYRAGAIDQQTMREFDALALKPARDMTPAKIRKLRKVNRVSQAVFAAYLNVSPSTVRQWEQGQKRPGGAALRLLNLVEQRGLDLIG